jgi:hypothetical protein
VHFRGTWPRYRRTVEGVTGPAAGLGDQVAVQLHSGGDRAVAEPAGHLGDGHALGQGRAGEGVPQIVEGGVRLRQGSGTGVAFDRGRRLLETMPYPENLDNHFAADPAKFDFYAMDCYRMLADDKMAENLANEVIRASTDFDGRERAPMRLTEAHVTLGVVAARQGDVDTAVAEGEKALSNPRKSLPSLLMASRDLTRVLTDLYPAQASTQQHLDHLHVLGSPARGFLGPAGYLPRA